MLTLAMPERIQQIEEFQATWPLARVEKMTLDEYTNDRRDDSFVYWLEFRLLEVAGIRGSFAYKFGIFRRSENSKDHIEGAYRTDKHFAWEAKYGEERDQAFATIRAGIIKVVKWAQAGDFEKISDFRFLTNPVKWKIAYLYQPESLVPIFNTDWLQRMALTLNLPKDQQDDTYAVLKTLLAQKPDGVHTLAYSDQLLEKHPLKSNPEKISVNKQPRLWVISPGEKASEWKRFQQENIIALSFTGMPDLREFPSKTAMGKKLLELVPDRGVPHNDQLACWDFLHSMKTGDIVVARRGTREVLGYGIVCSDYDFNQTAKSFQHQRRINWLDTTARQFSRRMPIKTLTEIRPDWPLYQPLLDVFPIRQIAEVTPIDETIEPESFKFQGKAILDELLFDPQQVQDWLELLRYKKNIVLQGPPGTGKTFLASRLARLFMEALDPARVEMVQFHQSYAYEDFIQGYRPDGAGGFGLQEGVFYRFCQQAADAPDLPHIFIIDEINRGNLSKIFGEIMLLIERDKRGHEHQISLTYSPGEHFSIPENIYLIGTMNTADRSLAMMDYALRRRFAFINLDPCLGESFLNHLQHQSVSVSLAHEIQASLLRLNQRICEDPSLGRGFQIGHSYCCLGPDADEAVWWERIVRYELAPTLEEYWFDRPETANREIESLLSCG